MQKIEPPKNESGVAHITFEAKEESGNEVLRVDDVKLGYDPTTILADPVNIQLISNMRSP
ncbi:Uncharacterised protein [Weissella viridescens]|uniref:Uncharacterized protein n=1 Tax=Weissella viridescens TaxID=1629 RepID=A0A380NYE0_WEIVI|nr:Uncharacterised protein [Weissella viridescens]